MLGLLKIFQINRSSISWMLNKIDFLQNFAKFTEKHLAGPSFLIKLLALPPSVNIRFEKPSFNGKNKIHIELHFHFLSV